MKKLLSLLLNFIFKFTKIQNNKIIFESGRMRVDDNPLVLYKYIKANHPNQFRTIWIVKKGTDVSMLNKGDYYYNRTLMAYYHLATSKYWIRSQSLASIVKKRKGQTYIQLWHGAFPVKKMGYDINNDEYRPPMEHVKDWDYLVSPHKYFSQIMRSSTGYDNKILILGEARTDSIKNTTDEYINEIKQRLNITDSEKKVVLYAPTFRDYELKNDKLNLKINKLAGNSNILVLLRVHPLINNLLKETKLDGNIINVSDYPDITDLFLITDILITDYSSVIEDFALLERPIVFYAYDYDEYVKCRGGFYLDYKKDLPGPIAYTEEQLIEIIDNIDNIAQEYKPLLARFNEKYNINNDGKVCERITNEIIKGGFK